MSAFLAIFSPLPILLLGLLGQAEPKESPGDHQKWTVRRWQVALACLTNGAIVVFVGGEASFFIYLVFGLIPSVVLVELLFRVKKLESAAVGTLVAMLLSTAAVVLFYSHVHHVQPWVEAKKGVSEFVDFWAKSSSEGAPSQAPALDPAEIEEWKQSLIVELPSAMGVLALALVWANLTLVLRLNPMNIRARLGLRHDFFESWKSPEWLIWPTIASGVTLFFHGGLGADIGRNLFKFLMAVYALQGLSILSFFFSRWKLNKIFRYLGYALSVLILMPLLLSIGFFDLWFDFRAKFRQS